MSEDGKLKQIVPYERKGGGRQVFLAVFWWLYMALCFACVSAALIGSLYAGEWLSSVVSLTLFLVCLYLFSGYLILSPVIFYSVRLLSRGQLHDAEKVLNRGLNMVRRLGLRKDWSYMTAVSNLAVVKLASGQFAESELIYGELMERLGREKKIAKNALAAIYVNNLAYAHLRQGELEEAEANSLKALEIWSKLKGNEALGQAFPLVNLAEIDVLRGSFSAAESKLERALAFVHGSGRPLAVMEESFHSLDIHIRIFQAIICLETGRREDAVRLSESVLASMQQAFKPPAGYNLTSLARLAELLLQAGDEATAERVLEHAYDQARDFPTHPDAPQILDIYERLLTASKRVHELPDLKAWVRPVLLS